MTSHRLLGAIYLALSVAMIAWDILMAGRIAQLRRTPRAFQAITGIAGLLLVPALVIAYTAQSLLYGRAIYLVAWLWPFTTLLFVLQSVYALARRLVTPLLGFPLLVYNTIIATVAVTKFMISRGESPAEFALALNAAQASMLGTFLRDARALESDLPPGSDIRAVASRALGIHPSRARRARGSRDRDDRAGGRRAARRVRRDQELRATRQGPAAGASGR